MADTPTTEDRVRKVISDHFAQFDDGQTVPMQFDWDDSLTDDLRADSLDRVEVTMTLEDEFCICIDDDAAAGWNTPGDMLATVKAAL